MKFIDICAGIGGFRLGLEQAGHECVGFVEFNKFAVASYRAMYDTEGEFYHDDITTIRTNDIPRADAWCFGFPCQDISVAGKQAGLDGSRSGIYFDIINLIKGKKEEDKPRWLLVENVKNLLSIDNGWGFARVLFELDEAGYDCEWQLLNSKNFGVPQNRERVFIVGHLRGRSGGEVFPISGTSGETAIKYAINNKAQTYRVYQTDGISPALNTCGGGGHEPKVTILGNTNPSGKGMNGNVFDSNGLAPTLTTNKGEGNKIAIPVIDVGRINKTQNGQRFKADGEPMFTLASQDRHGVAIIDPQGRLNKKCVPTDIVPTLMAQTHGNLPLVTDDTQGFDGTRYYENETPTLRANRSGLKVSDGFRIRKLTPKECFRLQGFPDEYFERAASVNSNSQLYKQAGNTVTVNVTYEIGKKLVEIERL